MPKGAYSSRRFRSGEVFQEQQTQKVSKRRVDREREPKGQVENQLLCEVKREKDAKEICSIQCTEGAMERIRCRRTAASHAIHPEWNQKRRKRSNGENAAGV